MTVVEGRAARPRPAWRAVAIPSEHGGWGLTLEPVLLGLLVAPSAAGVLIGFAVVLAFLARTPLKIALIDARRDRHLARSVLAARIAAAELAAIAALLALATARAGLAWWLPLLLAVPLFAVELHFDVRSRSRRLLPELCGAIGVGSAAAAIVSAGGGSAALAVGLWLVLAARAVGSIPFVRAELARYRGKEAKDGIVVSTQVAAIALAGLAVLVDSELALGLAAIVGMAGAHLVWSRRPPVPAVALGVRQIVLGLIVVMATAIGASLP